MGVKDYTYEELCNREKQTMAEHGKLFKEIRKANFPSTSAENLGADLGFSKNTFYMIEAGNRFPTDRSWKTLEEVFTVSTNDYMKINTYRKNIKEIRHEKKIREKTMIKKPNYNRGSW